MSAIVELHGLTKRFGTFTALDGISLAVERGEFLTVLGASGSGKTTTLRLIAGFDLATDGRILIEGADVASLPPFKRPVTIEDEAVTPSGGEVHHQGRATHLLARQIDPTQPGNRKIGPLKSLQHGGLDATVGVQHASLWVPPRDEGQARGAERRIEQPILPGVSGRRPPQVLDANGLVELVGHPPAEGLGDVVQTATP